jgi:hypothetical protein
MLCYRGIKRSYSHEQGSEDAGLERLTKKTSGPVNNNATANTLSSEHEPSTPESPAPPGTSLQPEYPLCAVTNNGEANREVQQDSASTETCFGMVIVPVALKYFV